MLCYSKKCKNTPLGDFVCFCNRKKFFCKEHQNGLSEQKKSCQIGSKCLLCLKSTVSAHKKFITIFSKNNVPFMVCSPCAILSIDHCVAKYIEKEENIVTVFPAREGSICDKCSNTIITIRPYKTEQNIKKTGWVWNDGIFKYRYCLSCIGKACEKS